LGFGATLKLKVINGTDYWRVNILGVDVDSLPFLKLSRKRITLNRKKHPTRTAFTVEALGEGNYAGFTLDKDGRFLLEDYTVTHNTEISCAITKYLGLPTLFMVTTRELLYQARERFLKRLNVTEEEVGIIGDGHWEPGTWVTIATVDTLESRVGKTECQDFLKTIKVLFADECHHLGSETWFEICTLCPADYRYGLSGTPMDRTDGANLRLLGAIGDIIVDIPNKFLVENGISARSSIIFSKVTAPVLPKKTPYATAYKQGIVDNPNALSMIVDWVKVFASLNLGTLVLCEEIAHGKAIDEALWTATDGVFIPHQFIYGEEATDVRRNTLKDFAEGRLPVLIASTILDEGVDVPTIDALILAGSRKSRIKTMQRLGRGLRGKKLIAVEFANFCHDHLLRHSLQRYEDYKKEDCFPLYQSGPDVELIKKIWYAEGS
jgi:superfamily II DNA or RNA helicase